MFYEFLNDFDTFIVIFMMRKSKINNFLQQKINRPSVKYYLKKKKKIQSNKQMAQQLEF